MDILKCGQESFHWDCSLLRVPQPYLSLHALFIPTIFPRVLYCGNPQCLWSVSHWDLLNIDLKKTWCVHLKSYRSGRGERETGKIIVQYSVGVLKSLLLNSPVFCLSPFLDVFELVVLKFISLVQASPLCSSYWLGISTGISSRHEMIP